jgi:hypothetical protein
MTDNFRVPPSKFAASYPYNQATVTRGGHEIHINDTPGTESLRMMHTKGSYVEMDQTGNVTQVNVAKSFYYTQDSFAETTEGHKDVFVGATSNEDVQGDARQVIGGSKIVGVGGDHFESVGGSKTTNVTLNKYETVVGEQNIDVGLNSTKSVGLYETNSTGLVKNEMIGLDWNVTAGQNIQMMNNGIFHIKCGTFIVDAGSIFLNTPTGIISLLAALDITMNAGGIASMTAGGSASITAGASASVLAGGLASVTGVLGAQVNAGVGNSLIPFLDGSVQLNSQTKINLETPLATVQTTRIIQTV